MIKITFIYLSIREQRLCNLLKQVILDQQFQKMKIAAIQYLKILITSIFTAVIFGSANGKAPILSQKELAEAPPRIIRTCCSFGADVRIAIIPFVKYTDITSKEEIGDHQFLGGENEKNGNIYTFKGGFIDMGHLRDCADWTAYLYCLINASKVNPELEVTNLGTEGGIKILNLEIPDNFESTDVYLLAGKIAYDLALWHEIATWYGASYVPMIPEKYSSFSPEDLYSNLLGVHLGIKALQSNLDYDEAMTQLISDTLDSLQAVNSEAETYKAMEKVENIWWNDKKKLPSKNVLIKRFMDNDNILLPWLIPDEKNINKPVSLVKPENWLNEFYSLKIKLNYKFPVKTLFGNSTGRTITQREFPVLIKQIRMELNELESKMAIRKQKKENRMLKRIS